MNKRLPKRSGQCFQGISDFYSHFSLDDLRRIRGIGPKNEGVLNALGIYHFEQIAALSPAQVHWLDNYLKFHGRIARDDWVGQAKALAGAEPGPADKVHPQDVGA